MATLSNGGAQRYRQITALADRAVAGRRSAAFHACAEECLPELELIWNFK
ncbi:hypothetical protein X566_11105 [Afipia sp. P52-10]|nr:hypothetical protein X566_11105 [Afipia sp. P52-10]